MACWARYAPTCNALPMQPTCSTPSGAAGGTPKTIRCWSRSRATPHWIYRMHPMADNDVPGHPDPGQKRNYKFLWIFAAVAVVAIVGILIYHFMVGRYHVTTKDAYVNGNMVRLQPQVTG